VTEKPKMKRRMNVSQRVPHSMSVMSVTDLCSSYPNLLNIESFCIWGLTSEGFLSPTSVTADVKPILITKRRLVNTHTYVNPLLNSDKCPPRVGPIMKPKDPHAADLPNALALSDGGNKSVIIALHKL
jgi:hypothetical protein